MKLVNLIVRLKFNITIQAFAKLKRWLDFGYVIKLVANLCKIKNMAINSCAKLK